MKLLCLPGLPLKNIVIIHSSTDYFLGYINNRLVCKIECSLNVFKWLVFSVQTLNILSSLKELKKGNIIWKMQNKKLKKQNRDIFTFEKLEPGND